MCVGSLSLIVIILGIIAYSENIKSLGIIENIKRALEEIVQSTSSDNQDNITTVDVTGIELGEETQHEHIYKTIYDENKHWEECKYCGEKRNETEHSLTRTWTLGYESCEHSNSYTDTCTCGYSKQDHKPCVWDGYSLRKTSKIMHGRMCSICKDSIMWSYYLYSYGNGKIYKSTYTSNMTDRESFQYCHLPNGSRITCKNGGTCSVCGASWDAEHQLYIGDATCKVYCWICNKEFGDVTKKVISDGNTPATYNIEYNVKLKNGAKYGGYSYVEGLSEYGLGSESGSITNLSEDLTEFTINIIAAFNSNTESGAKYLGVVLWGEINGIYCRMDSMCEDTIYYPDEIQPNISSIKIENSDIWSKNKFITILGTENYCNTVKIKILDDKNTEIYSGETTVKSGKYSISCTPELEAGLEGRTFKVIVTDACENSIEKEFTISKIDSIAPEITSIDKISEEWKKEKNIIFTANDSGAGNVQIAFNDVTDYELASKNGTEYSREYKLVGDVYSPREANVYYKDELGNVSTKKVIIDKLDNTSPTIRGASFSNNKLNITAHDRHQTEGEGSGVSKYRFITSTTKLENPEITLNNSTEVLANENMVIPEIYKVKYVYIVAEDAVGNISEVYEVKVPQLELTSKVNLSGANGKGIVELDWSSYDISNKYFVIYRKQENQTDWEIIVSLKQKYTGSSYIDNLGNDKNNPGAPNINIKGNSENNNIEITTISTDSGTKYIYYIEAYDIETNALLNKSNS